MKTPRPRAALVAALLTLRTTASFAVVTYSVEDLGVLPGDTSSIAFGVNARGDVVGWSAAGATTRAFVWSAGAGLREIPAAPGRPLSLARDVNASGAVAGTGRTAVIDEPGHAWRWTPGAAGAEDLGVFPGGRTSQAWGINAAGDVVGSAEVALGAVREPHAFLFTGGAMVDLTPSSNQRSEARAVNDRGQVTGYADFAGATHAFRWSAGRLEDLGALPGLPMTRGFAINASGQVAGLATSASGDRRSVFVHTEGAGMAELGGAGNGAEVWGMNRRGDVVGKGAIGGAMQRGWIARAGAGVRDLNAMLAPGSGFFVYYATDVNDDGVVVGAARNAAGDSHAVRLVPGCTEAADCDDGDACTADACDAASSRCTHARAATPACGAADAGATDAGAADASAVDAAAPDVVDAGGSAPDAAGAADAGDASADGPAPDVTAPGVAPGDGGSEGGCAVRPARGDARGAALLALGLAAALRRARRRRAR